jgi:hypothetical protein
MPCLYCTSLTSSICSSTCHFWHITSVTSQSWISALLQRHHMECDLISVRQWIACCPVKCLVFRLVLGLTGLDSYNIVGSCTVYHEKINVISIAICNLYCFSCHTQQPAVRWYLNMEGDLTLARTWFSHYVVNFLIVWLIHHLFFKASEQYVHVILGITWSRPWVQ